MQERHLRGTVSSTDDVVVTDERAAARVDAVDEQTDLPWPAASLRLVTVHDI